MSHTFWKVVQSLFMISAALFVWIGDKPSATYNLLWAILAHLLYRDAKDGARSP